LVRRSDKPKKWDGRMAGKTCIIVMKRNILSLYTKIRRKEN
jgi:hypothetical protein